jgi:hypothetical protein
VVDGEEFSRGSDVYFTMRPDWATCCGVCGSESRGGTAAVEEGGGKVDGDGGGRDGAGRTPCLTRVR